MAQEIAFAAPRAEEMTRTIAAFAGGGVTGLVEGVAVKMAPQLGALGELVKLGTLVVVPAAAAALAMFTRGILGDLFLGAACGGAGVAGYIGPEALMPALGAKGGGGQLPPGGAVKQLPPGARYAPERAQAAMSLAI